MLRKQPNSTRMCWGSACGGRSEGLDRERRHHGRPETQTRRPRDKSSIRPSQIIKRRSHRTLRTSKRTLIRCKEDSHHPPRCSGLDVFSQNNPCKGNLPQYPFFTFRVVPIDIYFGQKQAEL